MESLAIKISYFWARLIKKQPPNKIQVLEYVKKMAFTLLKKGKYRKFPALLTIMFLVDGMESISVKTVVCAQQSWALPVVLIFSLNKNHFLHFLSS